MKNTSSKILYQYICDNFQIEDQSRNIIRNIIEFVLSQENWGISFKSYALTKMLTSIKISEAEILRCIT